MEREKLGKNIGNSNGYSLTVSDTRAENDHFQLEFKAIIAEAYRAIRNDLLAMPSWEEESVCLNLSH